MAVDTYSVLRAADLVVLTVRGTGLREQAGADGRRNWVAADGEGRLIVDLPPQHIAETVLAPGSSTSQARLAGASSLHFVVPRGGVIRLSVEGVLAAMNEFGLAFTPRELGKATTLEMPWRLLLAVQEAARCRHRTVALSSSQGATQMWHTRILDSRRPARSSSGYAQVFPFASGPVEQPFANATPLASKVDLIAEQGRANPSQPVEVDKLILTACGGWFSGSVNYPQLEWTHRTAMGRDFYVRLLERGLLFPFGHQASVVMVAEREFDTATRVAGLRQKFALIITQPVREHGIRLPHEREFPFQRVEIEPVQVIDLDRPDDEHSYWLKRGGSPIIFAVRAWAAGEVVPMHLPLLFSDGTHSVRQLGDKYALGPRAAVEAAAASPTAVINRFIPLAMRMNGAVVEAVEDSKQQVQSVTIGANAIAGEVGFHPRLSQLEVALPAARQLLGQQMAAIPATLSPDVAASTPERPPDVLLQFASRTLSFGSAQAGVVAAPNMAVNQIHRTLGPTVASLPTDPSLLFDRSAKLLGIVPLADIIGTVTGRPRITWSERPAPAATLDWSESPTRTLGPFAPITAPPDRACQITLSVKTDFDGGRPKTTTHGSITNFVIGIPEPAEGKFLVRLHFSNLTFRARSGELPTTSFKITEATLGKQLRIVQQLGSYLPTVGNSGPSVEITAAEVRVRYAIAIPTPLSMGLLTFQNLLLQAGVTLSLRGAPVVVDFAFGTRAHPFLVTVMGFGGGGYLELGVRAGGTDGGLERFVGGIEFGASVAMNFGVAAGEVHVFGGVVFTKQGEAIEIAGYLRVGGMVRVLGLITVSIELTVSLTYKQPNILRGEAKLVIAVDLTFWSTSVEIGAEYEIAGSPALAADRDPFVPDATIQHSVEAALGPVGSSFPWQTYCQAFA